MKQKILKIAKPMRTFKLAMLAALICLTLSFNISAKEKIRLTTGEWVPYVSENLDNKGLFAQITVEAFATQDIEVELGFFPWQRVFQLSRTGEWDGTIAYAKTSEREQYYIYSEPVYTGQYALFHLKNHPIKWQKYTDLHDIRIAATRGFGGMGQEFLEAEANKVINVDRLASDDQSFNMLLLNRVQAVASDVEVGYVLLNKLFGSEKASLFTHSTRLIQQAKYHLVLAKNLKKSEELMKKFNTGLNILKQSGRYNQIISEFYQRKAYRDSIPAKALVRLVHQ
ncbi:transporter substrate-binding domain-containing protein [Bacteriovorax sp. PP10]|uniref:Transporter substrate-binding domain-containing protein n=1 Tax=Bacteriovorax antarcticus TaxID=3088717 RepID=A0ABU5VZ88_9BACT|nr:transporter substrate-binding domain-containing protein [Bacteriovorax sp. PP10]MEA9358391.1 transporter substrate-binding domain-containing protein [Bacteriovorax sp. PP10]